MQKHYLSLAVKVHIGMNPAYRKSSKSLGKLVKSPTHIGPAWWTMTLSLEEIGVKHLDAFLKLKKLFRNP